MANVANKLVRWFIFGVVVAIVPLAYSYLDLVLKKKAPTLTSIIGDGGLLLIISAICAGALGELIGSGSGATVFKIISSGGTIVTLLLSSFLFASIIEGKMTSGFDDAAIASTSAWIFLIGMLPCAACIALSEF